MAPSFENLPEDDGYDSEEEIDFSGVYKSAPPQKFDGLILSLLRSTRAI